MPDFFNCGKLLPWARRSVLAAAFLLSALSAAAGPAHAMKIQSVKSPGGIEAWLVEDHSVPLMAMRYSFEGGNSQDPAGREGVANFLSAMLDEGAGDLDAEAFQERLEDLAVRMSFEDTHDGFYGNFETLTVNRDKGLELLRLALTKPRFDTAAVTRIRGQLLANLAYAARDPEKVAMKEWYELAFPGHPYGRPSQGTAASLNKIESEDLEAYRSRVFARSGLKVVVVGDIDAAALGKILDDVFGGLSETGKLAPVARTEPKAVGEQKIIAMEVPQSVATFGLGGPMRKDPDFMAAFVLNHIIGGGGFSARLMEEVREKRGLAYSVYTYLYPEEHASVLLGSVATKNESIGESLDVIRSELEKFSAEGPTDADLQGAKQYLVGSYALRFDTSTKIASQLLGIMREDLGIDYVEKRNSLIEAVTMDDIKRVAKRLLKSNQLLVTIVGQPTGMSGRNDAPASGAVPEKGTGPAPAVPATVGKTQGRG